MKRCCGCGETKPREAFAKCRPRRDGLQSWCRACRAVYYTENRSVIAAKMAVVGAKHYAANREARLAQMAARATTWDGSAAASWNTRVSLSERRGHALHYTREEFIAAFLSNEGKSCPCCGTKFAPKNGRRPSPDRIDNDFGYSPANVVWVCKRCHTARGKLTVVQWLDSIIDAKDFSRAGLGRFHRYLHTHVVTSAERLRLLARRVAAYNEHLIGDPQI